jgi:hypothetical protein
MVTMVVGWRRQKIKASRENSSYLSSQNVSNFSSQTEKIMLVHV